MLINLAIWYLRKKNVSVLINYKVEGGKMKQLSNIGRTYDNELHNTDYYLMDGSKFIFPNGKFKIEKTNSQSE